MSSGAANPSGLPYWRLSAFYFCYFALLGAWLPYWPLFLDDRGFSAGQIGFLASLMMATKVVAPSFWGWLADRSRQRLRLIRLGSLLALVLFCGIFVHDSFRWLAAVIVLYSFFWNAVLAQFEVITLDHLQGQPERYSLVRVWGSIGFIAAVVLLGWLFDLLALSWLPWILAALLASIWLSSLTIAEASVHAEPRSARGSLAALLREPSVIAFLLCCFLMQVSHGPYYVFFSVYLEHYGYSRSVIGLLWSLGVVAEVGLFLVMHQLLQRFSLRQVLLASLLLSVLRWLLIAFWVDSLLWLLFAQCLHAASFGSFHAAAIETIRRLFGRAHQGQGMALYGGLSFGAGGAVGAAISGLIWDYSAALTFVLAALACLLAAALVFWLVQEPAESASATVNAAR